MGLPSVQNIPHTGEPQGAGDGFITRPNNSQQGLSLLPKQAGVTLPFLDPRVTPEAFDSEGVKRLGRDPGSLTGFFGLGMGDLPSKSRSSGAEAGWEVEWFFHIAGSPAGNEPTRLATHRGEPTEPTLPGLSTR